MSEAQVQDAPASEPAAVEAVAEAPQEPKSFNIFEKDPPAQEEPVAVESVTEAPAVKEKTKSREFLDKVQRDKERRASEIAAKKQAIEMRKKEEQLEQLMKNQELLRSNPHEFLKSQGINPLEFQRSLAEGSLDDAIANNSENRISKTQMELAKLKTELQQKEQKEQQRKAREQQQVAINKFVSDVDQYRQSYSETYPLVAESLSAQEIAQGMAEHYKNTGEELSIEAAFEKLESAIQEHEQSFYADPKVLEKLQRYNPEAFRKVSKPQATLSAKFKEQPTRVSNNNMSYEEVREKWNGKLFTS